MRASEGLRQAEGEAEGWGLVTGDAHPLYALEHGVEELPMAILTMVLLTVALLTMALPLYGTRSVNWSTASNPFWLARSTEGSSCRYERGCLGSFGQ